MVGTGMISVRVDVAGMYYRPKAPVKVPKGSSVLKALEAVRDRDIEAFLADGSDPIFDFSIETGPTNGLFINEIAIIHRTPAISGQSSTRKYEAGRYAYPDDPVGLREIDNTTRLVRTDGRDLPYVLAWQYYLYDNEGRDLARKMGSTVRKVEPVSQKILDIDVTIVWRLIAIFVKPTELPGIKALVAKEKPVTG